MSTPRLLPDSEWSKADDQHQEIVKLRRKIGDLEGDLDAARGQLREAQRQRDALENAVANLREKLSPIHKALRIIFGEIEFAIGSEADGKVHSPRADSGPSPRNSAVWDSWKARMGAQTAKVIDALLLHGEMNTTQLIVATGVPKGTMPSLIYRLHKASLINKNGGVFSLKEL